MSFPSKGVDAIQIMKETKCGTCASKKAAVPANDANAASESQLVDASMFKLTLSPSLFDKNPEIKKQVNSETNVGEFCVNFHCRDSLQRKL